MKIILVGLRFCNQFVHLADISVLISRQPNQCHLKMERVRASNL